MKTKVQPKTTYLKKRGVNKAVFIDSDAADQPISAFRKKRDIGRIAFIDTAVTDQGKFLLAVFIGEYQTYKVFDCPVKMDKEAFEFISEKLNERLNDFDTVQYDGLFCGIKLLDFVIGAGKQSFGNRSLKGHYQICERKMYQLIKNN